MAITEMSLPIDIPWKRMGVAADMIDVAPGADFPKRWRSSISLFYHEPTEVPPEYCNRKITYLKIVCTITNYQIAKEDENVSVLNELKNKYSGFYAWKDFDLSVNKSHPCYGALLQVSVFPNPLPQADEVVVVGRTNFPYIQTFQPRKREMYEVRTESGDVTSQSGGKLNVLKGTTSTNTTEDYDLEQGGGGGGGSILWGAVSAEGKEAQKNEGTVDRYQSETQNITNMDISREKRESHAYSTNLNQLYTLLQGYHLGTNRAMFFMQPRPHMQDAKFTFVRGLRRLEGIQEFFLVVNRPATVPGICVQVALETAHIKLERAYRERLIAARDLFSNDNLNKTAEALGFSESDLYYNYEPVGLMRWRNSWNNAPLDTRVRANDPTAGYGNNLGVSIEEWFDCRGVVGQLPEIGFEDVALIFEEYESDTGDFFVTGRLLCACVTPTATDGDQGDNVDCEKSEEAHISTCDKIPGGSIVYTQTYPGVRRRDPRWQERQMKAGDLNAMIDDLNEALWSSLASTERSAYGEVSFFETDFMLDELAQFLRLLKAGGDIQDRPLTAVDSMRPFLEQGLGRTSGARSIVDVGMLSTTQIIRDLNITKKEASKIRRDLLFAALTALDAKTIKSDVARVNPIVERFHTRFPRDRLHALARSGRGVVVKPSTPKKGKAGRPDQKRRKDRNK